MYPSANRDEREWKQPDEFDITRDVGHVSNDWNSPDVHSGL